MKLKTFAIIVVTILFASCVTQKRCSQKFPSKDTRDSIYIETIREIPVPIPGESISFDVPIDCDDQDFIFENARLRQQLRINDRKLQSITTIKPDTIFVTVHDTKIEVKEVKVPMPVEVIPQRFKNYRNICYLIFALAFGFVIWKVKKFFIK